MRVLLETRGLGLGVTTDSVAYLSSADSFLSDGRFVMHDGTPLVRWPPVYPAVLAGIRLGGLSALDAARLLNAVCAALIIGLTGSWLVRNVRPAWVGGLGAAALLVSIPLTSLSTVALSETLFAVVLLLFVAALTRAHFSGLARDAILAGGLAALAVLTRYAAIGIVLGGMLVIWSGRMDRRTITRLAAFCMAAGLPVIAWFLRNSALAGTTRGGWIEPIISPAAVIANSVDAAATTVMPLWLPVGLRIAVTLAIVGVLAALMIAARRSRDGEQRELVRKAYPWIGVFAGYYAFWIGCALVVMIDVNRRMFAPLYVGVVIILGLALGLLHARVRHDGSRWRARIGTGVITVGLLAYPFWFSWNSARYSRSAGGGGEYNTRSWRSSELARAVARLPAHARIVSNAPGAVYLWAGRRAREFGPRYDPPQQNGRALGLQQLERELEVLDSAYLAAFDSSLVRFSYAYSHDELSRVALVRILSRHRDGVLYEARRRPSDRAGR
jgi:hypothetical protein